MPASNLTEKQLILISDVREEMELYKEELISQIKSAKFNMRLGIGIAIVIFILFIVRPEFLENIMAKLKNLSENMEILGSLIGEGLPILFGVKSLNNSKEQQKRLKGVKVFEKDLSRMEEGIIANSEEQILSLEKDFSRYINT
ncbi:hypothetical protein [Eudoraea sp.]|uniref:hypothetical protein n=1 Tax=Eudoraea sp. TaxID=1979955 RepID=UPI003C750E0F